MLIAELLSQTAIESIKDLINSVSRPAPFFLGSFVLLGIALSAYRWLTKPKVAATVAGLAVLFFVLSCFDSNFRLIVTKPDNVPIVMMLGLVGFLMWVAFRQAAINDQNMEDGKPLIEAGSDDRVLVWPDLVYSELIALILCSALLLVWAIVLRAPVEQPADPNVAPNPAKAPWYFLGLQELLVYFDPWIAGVLLPGLIVMGLICVPYMDKNPRGNGYYTFKERPFAVSMFILGFMMLWVLLIVFGTFLRGPNWNFFGPYEFWDHNRPAALLNTEARDLFWVRLLGRPAPEHWLMREAPGLILVGGYFSMLPVVLAKTFFRRIYRQIGFVRFVILIQLFLWMLFVPIKMVLRWTLNLHYIVGITELPFNI